MYICIYIYIYTHVFESLRTTTRRCSATPMKDKCFIKGVSNFMVSPRTVAAVFPGTARSIPDWEDLISSTRTTTRRCSATSAGRLPRRQRRRRRRSAAQVPITLDKHDYTL